MATLRTRKPERAHVAAVDDDRARREAVLGLLGAHSDVDVLLRVLAGDGHTTRYEAAALAFEMLARKKAIAAAVERDLGDAAIAFDAETCAEDIARMAQIFSDSQHAVGVLVAVDDVIDLLAAAHARRHRTWAD